MLDFLYSMSDLSVFVFFSILLLTFSFLLIFLNRVFIFYRLKYKDNPTTASIASLIGIIYGVLVGFVCLYLLNNNDRASTAAMNEGTAAVNIYRESKWLKNPTQQKIQLELKNYVISVINTEWPVMADGKSVSNNNVYMIDNMSEALRTYPIISYSEKIAVAALEQEVRALFKGRQERLEMSQSELSVEIWEVILLSTILLVVINYAFRVNFYLHLFTISAFSIVAASILFLLITLDRPYQGEFGVEPDALLAALEIMTHKSK